MSNHRVWHWMGLMLLLAACREAPLPETVNLPGNRCHSRVCTTQANERRVTLRFHETPNPLKPFAFDVSLQGFPEDDVRGVQIAFLMRGMDMGRNLYRLQPGPEGYTGRAVLPICTSGRSDWIAEVRIETPHKRYVAPFGFEVQR